MTFDLIGNLGTIDYKTADSKEIIASYERWYIFSQLGITGEYATPAGYLVNEKEAEAFDREFPYMEKKKLPGQIFEGDIR